MPAQPEIELILAETRAVVCECGKAIALYWRSGGPSLGQLVDGWQAPQKTGILQTTNRD